MAQISLGFNPAIGLTGLLTHSKARWTSTTCRFQSRDRAYRPSDFVSNMAEAAPVTEFQSRDRAYRPSDSSVASRLLKVCPCFNPAIGLTGLLTTNASGSNSVTFQIVSIPRSGLQAF